TAVRAEAFETARLPVERPGDYAGHGVVPGQDCAGSFTPAVQFVKRHDIRVGRHLKDAVGARVDDRFARGQVFFAEVTDDVRTRRGVVAEVAAAHSSGERLH